jgi:hypothetical protein
MTGGLLVQFKLRRGTVVGSGVSVAVGSIVAVLVGLGVIVLVSVGALVGVSVGVGDGVAEASVVAVGGSKVAVGGSGVEVVAGIVAMGVTVGGGSRGSNGF